MDSAHIASAWPLIILAAAGLLVIALFAQKSKEKNDGR